jgi:hypothetical protein
MLLIAASMNTASPVLLLKLLHVCRAVCVLPQMLCEMFKLQVIMLSWDRKEAEAAVGAAAAVLQQLEQPGSAAAPAFVALLKLQFTMLQVGLEAASEQNYNILAIMGSSCKALPMDVRWGVRRLVDQLRAALCTRFSEVAHGAYDDI